MKQLNISTPENTYTLTDSEIAVIHAMAFYFAQSSSEDTGMTKKAFKIVQKMEEQFRMHPSKGNFQVWE